jgi:hypothetical protein
VCSRRHPDCGGRPLSFTVRRGQMRRLFVQDSRTFVQLARVIREAALSGFAQSLRDGLNLGGGDYYLYERNGTKVLLVHNDSDHPDIFVPAHAGCAFSMYVHSGDDSLLDAVCRDLNAAGVRCYLAHEFEGG